MKEDKKMTEQQKKIVIETLQSKKAEILNYDRGEDWAEETLEAIDRFLMNDWILNVGNSAYLNSDSDYLDSDAHLGNLE